MFYSRPKIEPLDWDLAEFKRDGTHTFLGRTGDNRPVNVKYRMGSIQVRTGAAGAGSVSDEPILSARIGPRYHGDALPEQICDILGFTIRGFKPVISKEAWQAAQCEAPIMDWSGDTTYWESWHFIGNNDGVLLFDDIARAFPNLCLIQSEYSENVGMRFRRVEFLVRSDEAVTVGIGYDETELEAVMRSGTISHARIFDLFRYRIDFRAAHISAGSGVSLVNHHKKDKEIPKFETINNKIFSLKTSFATASDSGRVYIKKIESIINRHFSQGHNYINLETGDIIESASGDDLTWHSNWQKSLCDKRKNSYLSVGVRLPPQNTSECAGSETHQPGAIFYGIRPR